MSDKELRKLAEDIRFNGLMEPITLLDGKVLDGRNRMLACEMVAMEPDTQDFNEKFRGFDPIRFVLAKNERRRHLPANERAMIAETLAAIAKGQKKSDRVITLSEALTQEEAAEEMGVSVQAIKDARTVKKNAAPNVIDMVRKGDVGMQVAARAASATPLQEQAKWKSPKDVRAAFEAQRPTNRRPSTDQKAPRRNTRQEAWERRINRPAFRSLPPEETGKPVGLEALEPDPDNPTVTIGFSHIAKHGMVQILPITEQQRMDFRAKLYDLTGAMKDLANKECATAEEFVTLLTEKERAPFLRQWSDYISKIEQTIQTLSGLIEREKAA